MTGLPVHTSPLVPEGTMYVVAKPVAFYDAGPPMRFVEDPWDEAPPPTALLSLEDAKSRARYELERRRGLDFLARQLDRLCADVGLDPEVAWRGPRLAEKRQRMWDRNYRAFTAELRYGMSIIDPAHAVRITGI